MAMGSESDRGIEGMGVEAELRLKEAAMDGSPVGITISDARLPDNPLIYVNDQFVELTGYERAEILGANCRFLQGPDTDMERVQEMAAGIEAAEPVAVELRNYRKDGSEFWNRVEIAPITDEDGDVTHYVGYQANVTDRKEAELALARERAALDHVLSRVTTLVPDITGSIVRARTREDLESALTDEFAGVADFSGAWLGRFNPSTDRINPVAGPTQPDRAIVSGSDTPAGEAVERAIDGRTVEVVTDPTGLFEADSLAVEAVALIPLEYRQTVYGLLAVAAPDASLFDDRETAVLGAMGQTVGAAINALESSRLETAETVIEVRLEITDDALELVSVADAVDAEVTAENQPRGGDEDPTLLLTVAGTDGDSVAASLAKADIDATLVADRDAGAVVEWTVPEGPLQQTLVDAAVRLVSLSATPSGARLSFEAASEHMANTVVGRFRDGYAGVELLAFHEIPAREESGETFRAAVAERLTDRQQEALEKAFVSGFFAWPRDVEGEELAAAMDIHPSTFHQHLRAAERKVLEAYFER